MEKFVKGDVVVPFPFSDLTQAKRRPALVLAPLDGDDVILCQITSQTILDGYSVALTEKDFETGTLKQQSHIRPNRLFTADGHLVLYKAGHLNTLKVNEVLEKVLQILKG